MKKEANFSNTLPENSNKKYEKGERNDVMTGVRKNLNFINEVTEIAAAQMKCLKERSARKEKSNCGNQVTEIIGEEREKI